MKCTENTHWVKYKRDKESESTAVHFSVKHGLKEKTKTLVISKIEVVIFVIPSLCDEEKP